MGGGRRRPVHLSDNFHPRLHSVSPRGPLFFLRSVSEVRSRRVERWAGFKSGGGTDPRAPPKGTDGTMGTGGSGGDGGPTSQTRPCSSDRRGALLRFFSPTDVICLRNAHPVTGNVSAGVRVAVSGNSEFTSNPVSVDGCKHPSTLVRVRKCPRSFSGNSHPASLLLSGMGKVNAGLPILCEAGGRGSRPHLCGSQCPPR